MQDGSDNSVGLFLVGLIVLAVLGGEWAESAPGQARIRILEWTAQHGIGEYTLSFIIAAAFCLLFVVMILLSNRSPLGAIVGIAVAFGFLFALSRYLFGPGNVLEFLVRIMAPWPPM